jgi:hypothetical protein
MVCRAQALQGAVIRVVELVGVRYPRQTGQRHSCSARLFVGLALVSQ